MGPADAKSHRKLSTAELGRVSQEAFRAQQKLPVTLVLDNVRSMHNVGSVFRTSDAFALDAVVLCGITGTPPHREIEKTALGATQSVAWTYAANSAEAITSLKNDGHFIIAVEQTAGSAQLGAYRVPRDKKLALVFGNEVSGVSDEVLALADAALEIPQFGTKHSFNIVVSAGIVLWDIYLQLRSI